MKKILLISLIGTVFAATSAFACDTCAKHNPKSEGQKMECSADCDKPCCAEKKACCAEGSDKACCAEKEACPADCDKPCCAKKEADTAATKTEGAAACCDAVLGKAA